MKSSRRKKSTNTTIPFFKDNQFDYSSILTFIGLNKKWTWLIYLIIVVFIISQYQMVQIN